MIRVARFDLACMFLLLLVIGVCLGCFWQSSVDLHGPNGFPETQCLSVSDTNCYWVAE